MSNVPADREIEELGNVTVSRSVIDCIPDDILKEMLWRHVNQDYGNVSPDDAIKNDMAFFKQAGEVRSLYIFEGWHVAIITKWNQPLTGVMMEGE